MSGGLIKDIEAVMKGHICVLLRTTLPWGSKVVVIPKLATQQKTRHIGRVNHWKEIQRQCGASNSCGLDRLNEQPDPGISSLGARLLDSSSAIVHG